MPWTFSRQEMTRAEEPTNIHHQVPMPPQVRVKDVQWVFRHRSTATRGDASLYWFFAHRPLSAIGSPDAGGVNPAIMAQQLVSFFLMSISRHCTHYLRGKTPRAAEEDLDTRSRLTKRRIGREPRNVSAQQEEDDQDMIADNHQTGTTLTDTNVSDPLLSYGLKRDRFVLVAMRRRRYEDLGSHKARLHKQVARVDISDPYLTRDHQQHQHHHSKSPCLICKCCHIAASLPKLR